MNSLEVSTKKSSSPLFMNLKRNWPLYTMVMPGVLLIFVFAYLPMYGIVMAFEKFKPALGFFHSPWADPWYKYFEQLFTDVYFKRLLKNTLLLGVYALLWGFPAPIILALLFNEIRNSKFKRIVQTISYMPYFLSTIVVIGILRIFFATDGPVNDIFGNFGAGISNIFMLPEAFRSIYIGSGIWSTVGYSSIIYLAAIAGINSEQYEAAIVDGANRFKQMLYITIPSLLPTITILLIFAMSGIIGNDYQKILLIHNEATYSTSDVIGTYVFRTGVQGDSQSYAAAAGLFSSVIAFVMLYLTNLFARKFSENSLW
ncbi:ABC transporter permease [Paenibacillus nasutitermitis]|uniref:Sugar ABC transporter permease n=1 Tax=Paenibacillus nasutitermitis TaxID=1652958 RepID=A0A917DP12_9BACL|nr:ABC transporter permease subunit [Paenibacillus nasutitermitis]GGD56283.1 sugar ABC transporter permease [Paenibacillus nasutitermitis]